MANRVDVERVLVAKMKNPWGWAKIIAAARLKDHERIEGLERDDLFEIPEVRQTGADGFLNTIGDGYITHVRQLGRVVAETVETLTYDPDEKGVAVARAIIRMAELSIPADNGQDYLVFR